MKLMVILTVVAWSNAAKLDRTYLPPSYAQTSGGSGNFLQTPLSGADNRRPDSNGFAQNRNNFAQNGNGFAQNGNDFAQNGNDFAQGGNFEQGQDGFGQTEDYDNGISVGSDADYEAQPERPQAALERSAAVLRQSNENDGETYSYAYETENGITAEENGVATNGVEAQGGYSYTGDDGQVYSIRYTAGENGFVPEGDHIPTAPPVPEEIQRALEQNARDEANGIYDDGTYSEDKYENEDGGNSQNGFANGNNYNGYDENASNGNLRNRFLGNNGNDEDSVVINSADSQPGFRNSEQAPANQGFGSQEFLTRNQGSNGFDATQREYLPPTQSSGNGNGQFNNQLPRKQESFGRQNQGANGFAAAQREYLPPTQSSLGNGNGQAFNQARNQEPFGQRNQGANGFIAGQREYLPPTQSGNGQSRQPFQRPELNGFRNQQINSRTEAETKVYLPPTQSSFGNGLNRQNNGFNGRVNGNGQRNGFRAHTEAEAREYLPPTQSGFERQPSRGQNGFRGQSPARNQAPRFGSNGNSAANREYLPPSERPASNGFGSRLRQPTFDARNGYQY